MTFISLEVIWKQMKFILIFIFDVLSIGCWALAPQSDIPLSFAWNDPHMDEVIRMVQTYGAENYSYFSENPFSHIITPRQTHLEDYQLRPVTLHWSDRKIEIHGVKQRQSLIGSSSAEGVRVEERYQDLIMATLNQLIPGFFPMVKDPNTEDLYLVLNYSRSYLRSFSSYLRDRPIDSIEQWNEQIDQIRSVLKKYGISDPIQEEDLYVTEQGMIVYDFLKIIPGKPSQSKKYFMMDQFEYQGILKPIVFKGQKYQMVQDFSNDDRNRVLLVRDEHGKKHILKYSRVETLANEIHVSNQVNPTIETWIGFEGSDPVVYVLLLPYFSGYTLNQIPLFLNFQKEVQLDQLSFASKDQYLKMLAKKLNQMPLELQQILLQILILSINELIDFQKKGFVHGDVKPLNMIVDYEILGEKVLIKGVHLFDYEVCFDPQTNFNPESDGLIGTPIYFSPEMYGNAQSLVGDSYFGLTDRGNYPRDWYALGKSIMEMVTGNKGFIYPLQYHRNMYKPNQGFYIENDLFVDIVNQLNWMDPLKSILIALSEHDPKLRMKKVKAWIHRYLPQSVNQSASLSLAA